MIEMCENICLINFTGNEILLDVKYSFERDFKCCNIGHVQCIGPPPTTALHIHDTVIVLRFVKTLNGFQT